MEYIEINQLVKLSETANPCQILMDMVGKEVVCGGKMMNVDAYESESLGINVLPVNRRPG